VDTDKRQLRLSMKQLVPSGLDEYLVEHKPGDIVTGRMLDISDGTSRVELGEGIEGHCRMEPGNAAATKKPPKSSSQSASESGTKAASKPDLSSLGSMLQARWKGDSAARDVKPEAIRAGEIRKFRISKLDAAAKKIELELV
jgi:small subunit ribosomal protein S1